MAHNPRLVEGDRVRLIKPAGGDLRQYNVGQTATVLELPNQQPAMAKVYRELDMYDVIFDEGGLLGLSGESLERIEGRGRVIYGMDGTDETVRVVLDDQNEPEPPPKFRDRHQVKFVSETESDGVKYPFGIIGTIILDDLDPATRARFDAEGRYAVLFDRGEGCQVGVAAVTSGDAVWHDRGSWWSGRSVS